MRYRFVQGRSYVAGFDKPFVASESAIREAVQEMGFRVLFAGECERLPLPFDPPGSCGDEWDYVGFVERVAPTAVLDVDERIKWIVDTTPPAPGEPAEPVLQHPLPPSPGEPAEPSGAGPEPWMAHVRSAPASPLWFVLAAALGYAAARRWGDFPLVGRGPGV